MPPGHGCGLPGAVRTRFMVPTFPHDALGAPQLPDPYALDVGEFADAEGPGFAPEARMLDPAERYAGIGADILVDEAHARFQLLGGDAAAAVEGGCHDPRGETVVSRT